MPIRSVSLMITASPGQCQWFYLIYHKIPADHYDRNRLYLLGDSYKATSHGVAEPCAVLKEVGAVDVAVVVEVESPVKPRVAGRQARGVPELEEVGAVVVAVTVAVAKEAV